MYSQRVVGSRYRQTVSAQPLEMERGSSTNVGEDPCPASCRLRRRQEGSGTYTQREQEPTHQREHRGLL